MGWTDVGVWVEQRMTTQSGNATTCFERPLMGPAARTTVLYRPLVEQEKKGGWQSLGITGASECGEKRVVARDDRRPREKANLFG